MFRPVGSAKDTWSEMSTKRSPGHSQSKQRPQLQLLHIFANKNFSSFLTRFPHRYFRCAFVFYDVLFLTENLRGGFHGVAFRAADPIGLTNRMTKGTWYFNHVLCVLQQRKGVGHDNKHRCFFHTKPRTFYDEVCRSRSLYRVQIN